MLSLHIINCSKQINRCVKVICKHLDLLQQIIEERAAIDRDRAAAGYENRLKIISSERKMNLGICR